MPADDLEVHHCRREEGGEKKQSVWGGSLNTENFAYCFERFGRYPPSLLMLVIDSELTKKLSHRWFLLVLH